VTLAVTAVAHRQRNKPPMHDDIWNDDDSWWHQQDLEMQQQQEEKQMEVLRSSIFDFEISVRSFNCLRNNEIYYVGDLVQKSESDLLALRHFGEKSLTEIKEVLAGFGLTLGTPLTNWPPTDLLHPPVFSYERQTTENPYEGWSNPPRLSLEQYKKVMKQKELRKQILSSTQLARKFGVRESDIANAWKQGYARYDKLLEEQDNAE
jgi:hypothetical protein